MGDVCLRPIAIHLPQFHPFEQNDEWWGKGFTEWTNVAKARPLFKNHYQPHLPGDLGFYDLRLEETRIKQAALAREHGIEGFCYYHYWFNGQRLMNRPLDDMIRTKTPDFPFMLCWANENWTRRWDGKDQEVLIKQNYSSDDDIQHFRFLVEHFFSDDRYIKVDKKPFFLFYRPLLFPNIRKTADAWRNEAVKLGLGELYLGYVQTFSCKKEPKHFGLDCAVEFQPDMDNLPKRINGNLLHRFKYKFKKRSSPYVLNLICSYKQYVQKMINTPKLPPNVYPGITPGWDNSPRKKKGACMFTDSSPLEYKRWLQAIKHKYSNEETFLFINAWNEWAEGNHLEPCLKWGTGYLEATKEVLQHN